MLGFREISLESGVSPLAGGLEGGWTHRAQEDLRPEAGSHAHGFASLEMIPGTLDFYARMACLACLVCACGKE